VNDAFTAHRERLFGIAYRMLGSVAGAEDVVQETYVRWQAQDRAAIANPSGWLVSTLTRLSIDELRSARRRREKYVGVWLPEPIVDATAPAPDAAAALTDTLGTAFLLLLEELGPIERAVFLLREAFDYDYAEIAQIVDRSEAACRQMVSRARARLAEREADDRPPNAQAEELVRRFLAACTHGKLEDLLAVLTDDAVLRSDGGGRVRAALRPIRSADHVGRFFLGIRERALAGAETRFVAVNGGPGLWMRRRDGHVMVASFAFADGRIRAIYLVLNPDKLARVGVSPAPEFPVKR
jgi:RNA polymerase sigma-70 factor (ECF subfamily)